MTQLLMMQSMVESLRGIEVILDSMKDVLGRFAFAAFAVARSIMSYTSLRYWGIGIKGQEDVTLVISTPIAFPFSPTFLAARKTSIPAPLPRSRTVSPSLTFANPTGFPQLKPRFVLSGRDARSSAVYPNAMATFSSLVCCCVEEVLLRLAISP